MVECFVGVPAGIRMLGVVVNRGWSTKSHKDMYWVLMDGEIKHFSHNVLRKVLDV